MNNVQAAIKWNIDRGLVHSIHTSVRRSFRGCRRRWDWAYRQKIYPKTTPKPLEFGVAFHAAMEKFYEPATWGIDFASQQGVALQQFSQTCDEQLRRYRKMNGDPDFEVLEDYKARKELGLGMIRHYTEFVSPQYDHSFKPIRVEVEFEVPIIGPSNEIVYCVCNDCWTKQVQYWNRHEHQSQGTLPNREIVDRTVWRGLPVTYGGRLDMLAEDNYGRLWIFDWKTTSRMMTEGNEEATLELDDQIASYVWALRSYYDLPVAGFVYVEIRKDFPRPPEPLTRKVLRRSYSINKQWFTTYEIASQFLASADTEAYSEGCYDDYLNWLKHDAPKFHQRHQVTKNEYEVNQIGLNIYYEARDIIENPRVYPQPGRFSCSNCAYRQPCLGQNQGEDYEYTLDTLFERKTRHYYEEQPSTTE